ncbi:MAG: hypothetical protein L3J96_00835 [Thermoplasmata archaeon]|nr:hypothetical protein [Thermoplasmata archaeon]
MPGAGRPVPGRNKIIVSAKKAQADVEHLRPVSYETAGIREVQDLERWILAKPEILGEELLILTDQFSAFEGARDRLDILCVDRQAHVVVVELKRTESEGHADLQSLRYAAMVRGLNLVGAAHHLSAYRRRKGKETSPEEATKEILEFVRLDDEGAETTELDTEPRIIIGSPGFSDPLLATADFLSQHGVDVTCVSLDAYTLGDGHFILVPDVVYPIRQLAPLLREIREKDATRNEARKSADRTHVDHEWWDAEVGESSMRVVDILLKIVTEFNDRAEPYYTRAYIRLRVGQEERLPFWINPKKESVGVTVDLGDPQKADDWKLKLASAGFEAGLSPAGHVWFRLTPELRRRKANEPRRLLLRSIVRPGEKGLGLR